MRGMNVFACSCMGPCIYVERWVRACVYVCVRACTCVDVSHGLCVRVRSVMYVI